MNKGIVKIVGAGIGPSDLITCRAKKALEMADVIIYDRLLNQDILAPYQGAKELYYAGKAASNHYLTQDAINELMVREAQKNKIVVRLKGGDPYIFGRGGEEAEFCAENNIPFEVIPGVTSGVVSLMYAGIPATHRDAATSISFITGHRKKGYAGNFKEYAQLNGTLVFYMGLNNLNLITQDLLDGGMNPEKPAAVIMNGAYPNQRVFVSTLGKISEEIIDKGFQSPSLIVIGDVINYRDILNFYENTPLFGKTIVVTRAKKQASTLVEKLLSLGATVIEAPAIEIKELSLSPLETAIKNLDYTHIIFHSVNAVDIFFRVFLKSRDLRDLHGIKLCSIGEKTSEKLNSFGLIPDIMPEKYVGENLSELIAKDGVNNRKLLLPHSSITREKLLKEYQHLGELTAIPIYETIRPNEMVDLPEEMDYILFTSSSTVNNFFSYYQKDFLEKMKIISIGPITTDAIEKEGFYPYKVSEKATIDSMIDCIKEDITNENA